MTAKALAQQTMIFLLCLMKAAEIQAHCNRPKFGENKVLTAESDKQTYTDGETADFQCAVGYEATSQDASRSITCDGKQWTKLELQCRKKCCGRLVDIPNGKYIYPAGTLLGATTTVQCKAGYNLVGENTRHCEDAGWSGSDPVCEASTADVDSGDSRTDKREIHPSAMLQAQIATTAAIEKLTNELKEIKGFVSEMTVIMKELAKNKTSGQA